MHINAIFSNIFVIFTPNFYHEQKSEDSPKETHFPLLNLFTITLQLNLSLNLSFIRIKIICILLNIYVLMRYWVCL